MSKLSRLSLSILALNSAAAHAVAEQKVWECRIGPQRIEISAPDPVEIGHADEPRFTRGQVIEALIQDEIRHSSESLAGRVVSQKIGNITKHARMAVYRVALDDGRVLQLSLLGIDEFLENRRKCEWLR